MKTWWPQSSRGVTGCYPKLHCATAVISVSMNGGHKLLITSETINYAVL